MAIPGSVVASGKLVTPGGAGGPVGASGDSDPVGTIIMWGTAIPPAGWVLCDGSAISRTAFPALYALIGTTFGSGDGSTTFNVPDLRGRTGIGAGLGSGLSNRILGANGGEETHKLVIAELASHTHPQWALTTPSTGIGWGAGSLSNVLGGQTTGTTGSDTPHNTMMPFLVVYYIIKASLGGGPTAQAPVCDPTQNGLMRKVSGNTTDFVDGTNNCQPISNLIPSGTVWDTARATAPAGWLLCDGTSYTTAAQPSLFAAIGYAFGGSGANFNVPDCRGRTTIGVGTGSGLTARVLGATGGEEMHLLSIAEMPSHLHGPGNLLLYSGTSGYSAGGGGLITGNTAAAGGGGTHNTMQPFIALNKIIKT